MKRLREPRFGMVVSDGTGTWMLVAPESEYEGFWRVIGLSGSGLSELPPMTLRLLLLDPDQFGEVEA